MRPEEYAARYCVKDGGKFRLRDFDPGDTAGLDIEKKEAKDLLRNDVKELSDLQERLYAEDRWSLLVIFQMAQSGKCFGCVRVRHIPVRTVTGSGIRNCRVVEQLSI